MDLGLFILLLTFAIAVTAALIIFRGTFRERLLSQKGFHSGDEKKGNPWIPDFIEKHPRQGAALGIAIIVGLFVVSASIAVVPAGHRGILLTFGKVAELNMEEGIHIIMPWQRVVNMQVMIQKAEVTESTASNDLQEITTKLAVHYKVREDSAWMVYQSMRMDYLHLLVEPVIMEELKATTADWTAEKLITDRPSVVIQLGETLDKRLQPYGIDVLTVNFIDFQFSPEFWDAIERKVVATQDALAEKNKVEVSRFQQLQAIITAQGQYNVTVIRANAEAQQKVIAARAEANRIMIEANATSAAIKVITLQMTMEYAQYLWLTQWDGKYPTTLLGDIADLGIIINP